MESRFLSVVVQGGAAEDAPALGAAYVTLTGVGAASDTNAALGAADRVRYMD